MGAAPRPFALPRSIPLIWLILAACAPASIRTAPQHTSPTPKTSTATPVDAPTPQSGPSTGCYYSWATRELPDLTAAFQAALISIHPRIQGSAYAFGEDCKHEDGTSTFLAMETDYRVRIPIKNLADEAELGGWVRRVVAIVEDLPPSLVVGTRAGRVEFEFQNPDSESLRISVDITRYRTETTGLDDSAIFRQFK